MAETNPSRAPWLIVGALAVAALAATVALPLTLIPEAHRPPTLEASIVIASVLELAMAGYLVFVFTPSSRARVPAALVPGWGVLLSLYAMGCAGIFFRCAYMPRLYTLLISLQTLLFLFLGALLLLVGRGRASDEARAREDGEGAHAWLAQVRALRPAFEGVDRPMPHEHRETCARLLRKVEERGRQVSPLGRTGREAQDAPVHEQTRLLAQTINLLEDSAPDEMGMALDRVAKEAHGLLRALDTREASLVR